MVGGSVEVVDYQGNCCSLGGEGRGVVGLRSSKEDMETRPDRCWNSK